MAFQQGLSGLSASSKALDVTSNNIANASTIGFKNGTIHFADVFANSLFGGGGTAQIGIGVAVGGVNPQFTQGNLTTTSNPLDISINGQGFYRMDSNGAITYTRNGQFHLDKDGFIINDQSMKLTGYPADSTGAISPVSPTPLQVSAADLPPIATGASVGTAFQGVLANLNLDSRVTTQPTWTAGPTGASWNPSPSSYNYSTAVSVYDTLGNAHALTMYFSKTANAGEWNVHMNVDGTSDSYVTMTGGPLTFDAFGQLTSGSPINVSIDLNGINADLGLPANAANTPLTFDIDFDGSTQFGSTFGTNRLQQDGYASGRLTSLTVGADGIVQGRYSNGKTLNQGQIVLANFTNPTGLAALGNNQWAETSTSGVPTVNSPGTSNMGVLQSASVEESNVDLTAELVNMITFQRNYQANAQSIKTQDQIMQTIVNLR